MRQQPSSPFSDIHLSAAYSTQPQMRHFYLRHLSLLAIVYRLSFITGMSTPPPRRIIGYQPTKLPPKLPQQPPPPRPLDQPLRANHLPTGSNPNEVDKPPVASNPMPVNPQSIRPVPPSHKQDEPIGTVSSTLQKSNIQGLKIPASTNNFPSKERKEQTKEEDAEDEDSEEEDSEMDETDQLEQEEVKSTGSQPDQDYMTDYQPKETRPNESGASRILSVREDVGIDEQRLLKKLIKKFSEERKIRVTSLDHVQIEVGNAYPSIRLKYRLNGSEQEIDIIQMYRYSKEKDKQYRIVLKNIFCSQFTVLQKDLFKKLYPVVCYRIRYLQKDFKAEINDKDKSGMATILTAIYSVVPDNRTMQFLLIDNNFNELGFNNYFIEKYKERFAEPYKFYMQNLKPRITNGKAKEINFYDDDPVTRPHVGDEEMSSDDEPIRVTKQVNFQEVKSKLERLFLESLTAFSDKISKKQDEFDSMRSDERNQDEDKQAILSEQISSMQDTLDDYRQQRDASKAAFDKIILGRAPEKEKADSLSMIYKKLRMLRVQMDSKLPIISRKKELFKALNESDLIVLEGETGSGKSTQLPQMLCEYYKVFSNPHVKPIVLTQPRKISTRTLAERIASEMDQDIHQFVDYMASSGNKVNPSSKIVVKLDRLLLDEFEKDPLLQSYSCLVIDEAHERTVSIDVIIGLVSDLLKQRKDFKVIITSATLDAALFERYFKIKTFKVSGRLYPVDITYKPYSQVDSLENKIYKCITEEIMEDRTALKHKYRGHVLVFCTGVDEISKLCDRMKSYLKMTNFVVVGLHGKLTAEEQKLAFSEIPNQYKFIFASRIAQTAITIDQVKVVIDPGQDRQTVYDQKKKISSFQMRPISRSAAKQRAGRAGRTSAGFCFKLYDESFEKEKMPPNKTPEIESIPLDIIVLRLKALKISDLLNFAYLSKPKQENLKASIESMQLIGCLDSREQITAIGRGIVKIPIQPLLSRAIIDAILLEKLDHSKRLIQPVIKILAIIANSQGVFYSNEDTREICEQSKFQQFADDSGDFFSLLCVYEGFEESLKKGRDYMFSFTRNYFLNKKSLFQCRDLVREIKSITEYIYINTKEFSEYIEHLKDRLKHCRSQKELILSCLITSFCQNLCLYSGDPQIGYTLVATKQPVQIYGSSFLALQGITPKWIVCYDIVRTSATFCKIAQEIPFGLLKACVSTQMFKKYGLAECERFNPFYVKIEKEVPSVVLRDLNTKKYEGDPTMPWLMDNNIIFDRDRNKVKFYALQENSHQLREFQDYLKIFTAYLLEKDYIHNYLGNITAAISAGCKVETLHLNNQYYTVRLKNVPTEYQQLLAIQYGRFWHEIERTPKNELLITFKSEDERINFISYWKTYFADENPELKKCKLDLVKNYIERKNRIVTGCMKIRFWAAQARKNNLVVINYCNGSEEALNKYESDIVQTQEALSRLVQGIRFNVTIRGNAINASPTTRRSLDEFEMSKILRDLEPDNSTLLRHNYTNAFRELDTTHSLVSRQEWTNRILKLFNGDVPAEDITVYGSCQSKSCRDLGMRKAKKNDTPYKQCEEHLTDLVASVNIFTSKVADDFIKSYNGKRGKLGTEKVHAVIEYKQSIMRIPSIIFSIFKSAYEHQKEALIAEFPGLEFFENIWRDYRGIDYHFLNVSSQERDKLITPIATIKKVFTKRIINLTADEVKAINRIESRRHQSGRIYRGIVDWVEMQFELEVHIDYATMRNEMKVYCKDYLFDRVEKAVRAEIRKLDEQAIRISYRGKNIYKVQEIIDRYERDLQINISYSEKNVSVKGNPQIAAEFRNEIEALVNNTIADCNICFNILSLPFRLLLCGHTFCSTCLCMHIRAVKEDPQQYPLKCPRENCKQLISIHDLRSLIDWEELSECCDRSIQRLVDNKRYHGCYTVNCQQIFDVERTRSDNDSFHCPMCNIEYCRLCKETRHEGMSCERYKRLKKGHLEKEDMDKLGIKKCKECGNGIEKNGGCNHVSCKCGTHICWNCEMVFPTAQKCQAHLMKSCGGLFPDGLRG